jgi:hypothetical protein
MTDRAYTIFVAIVLPVIVALTIWQAIDCHRHPRPACECGPWPACPPPG